MVGSMDMMESREQVIKPMMTSSWLETVKNYSELEGDSAIFSQDSVECLNWNTQDTGRAESPLRFDHEEVLHIDSSIEVRPTAVKDVVTLVDVVATLWSIVCGFVPLCILSHFWRSLPFDCVCLV